MRFSALRSRDFRLLLAGQAVSLTGSQMQQVAMVWQLYLLTNSPLSLGLLGAFRVTPTTYDEPREKGAVASRPRAPAGSSVR